MQYVETCIKFKKHQICHCRQSILVNRTPLLWWCTPSASDLEIPTEWVCNCWRWLKKFVGDSSRSLFEMAREVFFFYGCLQVQNIWSECCLWFDSGVKTEMMMIFIIIISSTASLLSSSISSCSSKPNSEFVGDGSSSFF